LATSEELIGKKAALLAETLLTEGDKGDIGSQIDRLEAPVFKQGMKQSHYFYLPFSHFL